MATTWSTLWMILLLISAMSMRVYAQTDLNIKMPCKYLDPNKLTCNDAYDTCTGLIHYHLGTANDIFERRQYRFKIPATFDAATKFKASKNPIKVNGKNLGSITIPKPVTQGYVRGELNSTDDYGFIRIQLDDAYGKLMEKYKQIDLDTFLFIPYQSSENPDAASATDFNAKLRTFLTTSALNTKAATVSEGHFLTKVQVSGKKTGRGIILANVFEIKKANLAAATGFEDTPSIVPAGKQDTEKASDSEIHYTNCKLIFSKDLVTKIAEDEIEQDYVRSADLVLQLLQDKLRPLDLHHRRSLVLHLGDRLER